MSDSSGGNRNKKRLDLRLVGEGKFLSREKARSAIMAGQVFVNGKKLDKPGMLICDNSHVEVRRNPLVYASRGGLKLEKAISVFRLDLTGCVALDVGASTGGFTDCLLRHGARLVYAVDVGYGQLAWQLRTDPRVVIMERTNIRHLTRDALTITPDFSSIDVSFISLSLVLPCIYRLISKNGSVVALIKPQFEAGPEKVGKKGVVRDPALHIEILYRITEIVEELGWSVSGLDYSPVTGPQGNIEYLIYCKSIVKDLDNKEKRRPEDIVSSAHFELLKKS